MGLGKMPAAAESPEGGMVSHPCRTGDGAGRFCAPRLSFLVLAVLLAASWGCGGKKTKVKLPPPVPARVGAKETGVASWYGHPYHGRRTSNGEVYDMNKLTAAHLRLPFGAWVRVTNLDNGRSVFVRINDRGPFVKGRIIDLSRAAAREIGMPGVAKVRVEVVARPGDDPPGRRKKRKRREELAAAPDKKAAAAAGLRCPAGPYWAVQVGAFREFENAQGLQRKLEPRYGEVRIIQKDSAKGRFYRVVVGAETASASARRIRKQLRREGLDGFASLVGEADATKCL